MVSHICDNSPSGDGNDQQPEVEQRILINHNINHKLLRDLLKGTLNQLPLRAVTTSVHIHNIVVTKASDRGLSLECEVDIEW